MLCNALSEQTKGIFEKDRKNMAAVHCERPYSRSFSFSFPYFYVERINNSTGTDRPVS